MRSSAVQRILADASADVVVILATWLVAQLSRDGANIRSLITEPSLRALVIALALWAGLWASRWLSTHDAEPPAPAAVPHAEPDTSTSP
jgi:hypothetical protein